MQLFLDTDTPPFLAQINHQTRTSPPDLAYGILKLVPAVASERTKYIAGYTFRMYSYDGYFVLVQSHRQREVWLCHVSEAEALHLKTSVPGRQGRNGGYVQFTGTRHRSYFFDDGFDTQSEAGNPWKRKFSAGEQVDTSHAQGTENVTPKAYLAPDRTTEFVFPGQLIACG